MRRSRVRARRRRVGILGVSRVLGVWVHEEHEFDVAAGEEGVDVVVLERVDAFEVAALEGGVRH